MPPFAFRPAPGAYSRVYECIFPFSGYGLRGILVVCIHAFFKLHAYDDSAMPWVGHGHAWLKEVVCQGWPVVDDFKTMAY
jgi:hypothetical protein